MLLPLLLLRIPITQGDALGYVPVAPSGRIVHNYCVSYFCILHKFLGDKELSGILPCQIFYPS